MTQQPEQDGPQPEEQHGFPTGEDTSLAPSGGDTLAQAISEEPSVSAERERIRAYLEQHRPTYSSEGLRRQLINAGYDAALVDTTIAEVAAPVVPPLSQSNRGCLGLLTTLGIFVFNFALVIGLGAIVLGGLMSADSGSVWAIGITLALALILEAVGYFMLRRQGRWFAKPIGWGILASLVSMFLIVVLFGACIALITYSM